MQKQHQITLCVRTYLTGVGDTVNEALGKAQVEVARLRGMQAEPKIISHRIVNVKVEGE